MTNDERMKKREEALADIEAREEEKRKNLKSVLDGIKEEVGETRISEDMSAPANELAQTAYKKVVDSFKEKVGAPTESEFFPNEA